MGQANDDPTRHRRFSISCRSPVITQLPQPAITGKTTAALGAANLHSCALLDSVRQIPTNTTTLVARGQVWVNNGCAAL